MSDDRDALRERIESLRNELARLRDELTVKLDLAGMEGKKLWETLEPHLSRTQNQLRDAVETARRSLHDREPSLELHLALLDARDRLRAMEPGLRAIGRRVREAGAAALAEVPDSVKLESRLAGMDIADEWQRRRREVERGLREVESFGRKLVDEIADQVERVRSERHDS